MLQQTSRSSLPSHLRCKFGFLALEGLLEPLKITIGRLDSRGRYLITVSRVLSANVWLRVQSHGSTSKRELPPCQCRQRTWYPYYQLDRGSTRHIDDDLEVLYAIKDHTYRWMG